MIKQELKDNLTLDDFSEEKTASNHIVLPYEDGTMKIFGVTSQDKTFYDGSYNQFSGHRRTGVFTIGISKNRLDSSIKRVGFMGTDNDQVLEKEIGPEAEYDNGLWDIEFELYVFLMKEEFHSIKGSFFVETTNNTYYWLKDKGSVDFEFDSFSRLILYDWYPDPH